MRSAWRSAWRDPSFRTAMFVALAAAVPIMIGIPFFFDHIGAKPGLVPPDPVIASFPPVDVTWLTFTVLYGSILFAVARAAPHPMAILRGMHAYLILQVMRMFTMHFVTLEPPPHIIPLVDPITAVFYPGGVPFLKDLFFSGHTATLALMVFLVRGCRERWFMVAATATVGVLVVIQHVHWSIDVLAAPLFTALAWRSGALSLRACGVAGA